MFHDPSRTDCLCGRDDFVIGRGDRVDAGLGKDICARKEMLRVGHEGHRHDVSVEGDHQVLRQVLAVFFNQIVQRTDQTIVHQLREGRVRNNNRSVFRRVRRQRSVHDLARLCRVIAGEFGGLPGAVLFRVIHNRVDRRKVGGEDADALAFGAAHSAMAFGIGCGGHQAGNQAGDGDIL